MKCSNFLHFENINNDPCLYTANIHVSVYIIQKFNFKFVSMVPANTKQAENHIKGTTILANVKTGT